MRNTRRSSPIGLHPHWDEAECCTSDWNRRNLSRRIPRIPVSEQGYRLPFGEVAVARQQKEPYAFPNDGFPTKPIGKFTCPNRAGLHQYAWWIRFLREKAPRPLRTPTPEILPLTHPPERGVSILEMPWRIRHLRRYLWDFLCFFRDETFIQLRLRILSLGGMCK